MNRYHAAAFAIWAAIVAACLTIPVEAPAQPVRLLGMCDGQLFAAMEESAFPATGCIWIEPINMKETGQ